MAHNIRILDNFEALRDETHRRGDALAAITSADIFYTPQWFENLARYGFGAEVQYVTSLKLLLATDPATGNAVCLPLLSGKTLDSLSNYFSSLYGPIIWRSMLTSQSVQDISPPLWNAVFQRIRDDKAKWPAVTLSPLDRQAPVFHHIHAGLAQTGYWVDSFFCFGNWYLEVANRCFDAYFLSLPSALRHSIARGQRRLTRHGSWHIDIHQTAGPILDGAIADFVLVYSQSWKGPESNAQFIPNLARMATEQGWLRLGVLKLDDQPIAAQLWLVKDQKASIYKLAYVNGFERFSAGSVLTHAVMRHVIELDRVQEVDYLTGDDTYKRDWMSHRRERWGIVAFNPGTVLGVWAACKHFGGKTLKKLIKRPPASQYLSPR